MALDRQQIRDLYGERAPRYDFSANLYYLLGYPERRYRRRAVEALRLSPGDTVVEIGCGTGLNFSLLEEAVGPGGRIVGVDLTEAMLDQARARVDRRGWKNVQLVQRDAADFDYPDVVDGIVSTFAITLVPEYDAVIERGVAALAPGGRFAILDLKIPGGWPEWLIRLAVWITSPFGVTRDLEERRPQDALQRHLPGTRVDELFFGCTYVAAGEKRVGDAPLAPGTLRPTASPESPGRRPGRAGRRARRQLRGRRQRAHRATPRPGRPGTPG